MSDQKQSTEMTDDERIANPTVCFAHEMPEYVDLTYHGTDGGRGFGCRLVYHFSVDGTSYPANPYWPKQYLNARYRVFGEGINKPSKECTVDAVSHYTKKKFFWIKELDHTSRFFWLLFQHMSDATDSLLVETNRGPSWQCSFAVPEDVMHQLTATGFFVYEDLSGAIRFMHDKWSGYIAKERRIERMVYRGRKMLDRYSRRRVIHGKHKPKWLDVHS